jgi:hypothetical protein
MDPTAKKTQLIRQKKSKNGKDKRKTLNDRGTYLAE